MATIVCGNIRCKYLTKSGFCGREFGIFNQFGMCEMWWDKRGQMRGFPLYDLEPEPQEADEHERPQAIFSEDISESDKVEGNDGK